MSFLPEDDQDYLASKGLKYELVSEDVGAGNTRRGIVFPAFAFEGNLRLPQNGGLAEVKACDLLILIPTGYSITKLDSFYTSPHLKRANGADPDRANAVQTLFKRNWQFWSRHLQKEEWRSGIDGIDTYLQYVRGELRKA